LSVLEEGGLAAASIEAIAARAGVGKQTIYRWWPTRGAIMLEALRTRAEMEIAIPDRGSVEEDLAKFLSATFALLRGRHGPLVAGLMAEAQTDAEFHAVFRESFINARRQAMRTIFERGRDRGQVARDVDVEVLVDLVYGAMWYRLLVGHAKLSEGFAVELAAHIATLAARKSRKK
jgi:AcrR family transcriptional regulator